MRNLTSLVSVIAGSVLLAASAHADDNAQANRSETNVFNADMSNPDLAAVITSFQEVCLPFITHKTELPQSLDIKHYDEQLKKRGYEHLSRSTTRNRYLVAPAPEPWKPASRPTNNLQGARVNNTRGKFTIFNGVSNQVVEATETTTIPTGEIFGPVVIPAKYKTVVRPIEHYSSKEDKRQTVSLGWNYGAPSSPAKSCKIKLERTSISEEIFEADFIEKDDDWRAVSGQDERWSQCTIDGPDEFEFTAERKDGKLSLSVRRNDFFELKLCGT